MPDKFPSEKITIAGSGLVGSLLSLILARRGYSVEMFEGRADLRSHKIGAGRSINLAISTRGINALKQVGLADEVMQYAIPMRGRMLHAVDGKLLFQPYGLSDSQCINSISRQILNKILLERAEETQNVHIAFNSKVLGVDLTEKSLLVSDENSKEHRHKCEVLIGTDGYASKVRTAVIEAGTTSVCSIDTLEYGYKELTMPAAADGAFLMDKHALHIWPRGNFMLIALPNFEGSFTCTLFLPFEGPISFANLQNAKSVGEFFAQQFPDALKLIPELPEMFLANPTGHMDTVKCAPWFADNKALLVGDAAHAIVPFFGQGMNCGFEDCTVFDKLLSQNDSAQPNWADLFSKFFALRKPNTDAIADMAVDNFVEMRDRVADSNFQLQKAVEKILEKKFFGKYISRYALVTFSNIDYLVALEAGAIENQILADLCKGIGKAEEVDLDKAEALIDKCLAPLLEPHAEEFKSQWKIQATNSSKIGM